jgi:HEAT repeat protein
MNLGFIASHSEIAVPALTDGLKEPRGQVRARSADALGYFGAQARSAVPVLLTFQNDPDSFVRECVARALKSISPEALQTNSASQGTP